MTLVCSINCVLDYNYINQRLLIPSMKCEICKTTIPELFLKKIVGTYVKDAKGKKHLVCSNCQRTLKEKKGILKKL